MTAKEQKIKEAYGEYWGIVKDFVDENGWIGFHYKDTGFEGGVEPFGEYETNDINDVRFDWRPKSLQGIENNNGWIRIESETDLPKDEGQYFVYSKVDYAPFYRIDIFSGRLSNAIHHVTGNPIFSHYQPIIKPLKPLF